MINSPVKNVVPMPCATDTYLWYGVGPRDASNMGTCPLIEIFEKLEPR